MVTDTPYFQMSNQENIWNGKTYDKTRPSSLKPIQMPPPKGDNEQSDWNENLYLHQYRAEVQSQVPPRHPPPGWGNWRTRKAFQ